MCLSILPTIPLNAVPRKRSDYKYYMFFLAVMDQQNLRALEGNVDTS